MKTSVLFLLFNRPDYTKISFERIRCAKPKRLYLACDGPRVGVETDIVNVRKVRELVSEIDWDCEVYKRFNKENEGCGLGVSNAINWFFESETEGIILEDDCIADETFFQFCEELLEVYREDNRIMQISGSNLRGVVEGLDGSYYFSKNGPIWGWATWRSAWRNYQYSLSYHDVASVFDGFDYLMLSPYEKRIRRKQFEYALRMDTWDFQWLFSKWVQCGWSVIPRNNLVTNIGFGENATHTKETNSRKIIKITPMDFPIIHPKTLVPNSRAEMEYFLSAFQDRRSVSYWMERIRYFSIKMFDLL